MTAPDEPRIIHATVSRAAGPTGRPIGSGRLDADAKRELVLQFSELMVLDAGHTLEDELDMLAAFADALDAEEPEPWWFWLVPRNVWRYRLSHTWLAFRWYEWRYRRRPPAPNPFDLDTPHHTD